MMLTHIMLTKTIDIRVKFHIYIRTYNMHLRKVLEWCALSENDACHPSVFRLPSWTVENRTC